MDASNFQGKWAVPVYLQAIRWAVRLDLPALHVALEREQSRHRPRTRLVAALEKRIAALEADGVKPAGEVAAVVMERLTRGTRFAAATEKGAVR
jgi:hypothetical protein